MKLNWLEGPWSFIGSLQKQQPGGAFSTSSGPSKAAKKLATHLLELGGQTAVISAADENLFEQLLEVGGLIEPSEVVLKLGRPSDCHGNSARRWGHRRKARDIATGYALSDDGLWRRHSWVLEGSTLIETTEARTVYFGFVLPPAMAKWFHQAYA